MKSSTASKSWKDRFEIYAVTILPILGLVYVHAAAHIMFFRIDFGMHEVAVERIYGAPDKHERTMIFCDRIFQWSGDCPQRNPQESIQGSSQDSTVNAAPNSGHHSSRNPSQNSGQNTHQNTGRNPYNNYQFFKKGIDRWVVIGFDSEHRVAFKTIGSL